ncbi:hypothetical protein [Paraburkholderia youngii]|uniref:hypothetical protein n=1 Tax=Paraburkholderia youngii TaxID=2782701 RepID=UPI003D23D66F
MLLRTPRGRARPFANGVLRPSLIKTTHTFPRGSTMFLRVAALLLALLASLLMGCTGGAQLADQPNMICAAATGASASRDLWQPDSPGFGFACLPSEVKVGPRGGPYDSYTVLSARVVGRSHTQVDRIELIVDLANPLTAQEGLSALNSRVTHFFSVMHAPVPTGLGQAIRAHREIAFDTSFGPGSVFVKEGRVPMIVVQIVRRGLRPDRGV